MAPRSSWKGFIKLSLVSVPVKAFTAHNTGEEIRLNQLHATCHSRVKYQKICPEHGELKADEIVSGYEYAKGQYVIIDAEELSKIRAQSERSIAIDGFVERAKVDPIYLSGKTYYLLPDGVAGNKPYALLVRGMAEGDLVAMAQIVLSGREQLVMLRPDGELMVMSVLNYAQKVKGKGEFSGELEQQEIGAEELKLTRTLIGASLLEDFDFGDYKDQYVAQLTKLIEMKVEGKEIVAAPDHEEPKIINLMEALKQSVAAAKAGGTRKMAASVKPAAKPARKKKSG